MEQNMDTKKRSLIAAAAGLSMTGMGQIYNGELLKGLSFYIIFIVLPCTLYRVSMYLPDRYMFAGVAIGVATSLGIYIFAIIEALKYAKKAGTGRAAKPYNQWYFYLALWMSGAVLLMTADNYTRQHMVEAYKIVTSSMEPEVLQGDHVLVDKTAYNRMAPKVGDIVIHVFPDDRSMVYIRRIAGMPGDTITLADGSEYGVPHGHIYVLGVEKEKSQDSRYYGPVPLSDVLGKARQVYFSTGPQGVRWGRIGATINPT